MPEGAIRHRVPQRHTARQMQHWPDARGETRKNSKCKETSWTSRHYAKGRSSTQGTPILSSFDHVCNSSVELKKKSELSQESAVAACKKYVPYISDITRQIEEVVKIFAMEKELRLIKNRGYFPVPHLAPRNVE